MPKNKIEKQKGPGEARLFDPERDMKDGKTFVLDEGELIVEAGKTSTFDIELHAFKNDNSVVINAEDIITVGIIDYDNMSFTIMLEKSNGEKQKYLVGKDFFQTLRNYKIRVIKPRKAPKVEEVEENTKNQVEKLIDGVASGFTFKAKSDIPEKLPTSLHGIKKGATIILDSREGDNIGLKVFNEGVNISKKGVLKSDFKDINVSIEQFEILFGDKIMTNFRKKASKVLSRSDEEGIVKDEM